MIDSTQGVTLLPLKKQSDALKMSQTLGFKDALDM